MMISIGLSKEWFEDIMNDVPYVDPYYYTDNSGIGGAEREMVEVDVDEEVFEWVSKEKGWM